MLRMIFLSFPSKTFVTDRSIHVAIRRRIELAQTFSLYDFVHSQEQIVRKQDSQFPDKAIILS
ncbi:MAG: hypothetical protein K0U68_15175 [Gammaproteobacteria bacterium]|nr:hypothetical protein [Gammaproteobacteria bacterium]